MRPHVQPHFPRVSTPVPQRSLNVMAEAHFIPPVNIYNFTLRASNTHNGSTTQSTGELVYQLSPISSIGAKACTFVFPAA
jgi:hypothetical protein